MLFFIIDIDKCEENSIICHVNAECVKLMNRNGYACKCKDGFEGDGFSCKDKGEKFFH